jgi:uncharacterized RDD family membrane protein YckC
MRRTSDAEQGVSADLPLFGSPEISGEMLPGLPRATPPRPPLAVRRATPEVPRLRVEPPRTPLLDLTPTEPSPIERPSPPVRAGAVTSAPAGRRQYAQSPGAETAALSDRALAAVIDLAVLGLIDAIVVYFTLKICGLSLADLPLLPKAPLVAFLILQNGGYLAAFTAGGQTLGKMTAGIRVVSVDGPTLDLSRSLKRTLLWALLAVPAGLGFATAVFSPDRRGLHDRVAGTRVVRAGAA